MAVDFGSGLYKAEGDDPTPEPPPIDPGKKSFVVVASLNDILGYGLSRD
jgi:hypothetical protein